MTKLLAEIGTRERSSAFRWGFALAAFLAAFGARLSLADSLPPGFPFLTFFPAIIVTTFLCGLWPGVAIAVISGLAAWYFFIPPFRSFALGGASALALLFYAFVVAVDITVIYVMNTALARLRVEREQLRTERVLSQRLADGRETMFKELQHRISNNLQVVSALMTLQKAAVKDEHARRVIDEASGRLALIGKIHRQLHDPSGQQVEFGSFLRELCGDVLAASGAGDGVACLVTADAFVLPSERTVPLALIVTEIVSNALEHGFAGRDKGTISVELTHDAEIGAIKLSVADDGPGLAPDFHLATVPSLGLRIVKSLAAQLDGTFEMASSGGTVCRLTFSADRRPSRADPV